MSMVRDVISRYFPMTFPTHAINEPSWLIDVGVGAGTEARDIEYLWPGRLQVIGLEPSAAMYEASLRCVPPLPGKILNIGAWSHARRSMLRCNGPQSSLYGGRSPAEEVELRPLDELIRDEGVSGPTILWLDIEGAELEALRGAWNLLTHCVVLVNAEVRRVPKFAGACAESEVDAFLASFGFAKIATYNVHHGDDPHHDAVYVRTKCIPTRRWR